MDEKGLFLMKGSVEKAAEKLGVGKGHHLQLSGRSARQTRMKEVRIETKLQNKGHYVPGMISGNTLYISGSFRSTTRPARRWQAALRSRQKTRFTTWSLF